MWVYYLRLRSTACCYSYALCCGYSTLDPSFCTCQFRQGLPLQVTNATAHCFQKDTWYMPSSQLPTVIMPHSTANAQGACSPCTQHASLYVSTSLAAAASFSQEPNVLRWQEDVCKPCTQLGFSHTLPCSQFTWVCYVCLQQACVPFAATWLGAKA